MKKVIKTDVAPKAIGPYSQGIICGGMIFLSGQIALTSNGEILTDKPIEEQTKLILDNIGALLRSIDCSYENIVKTTIFLTDMNDFNKVNEIYASYFEENPPARSCVEVANLPKNAKIEIECIAFSKILLDKSKLL